MGEFNACFILAKTLKRSQWEDKKKCCAKICFCEVVLFWNISLFWWCTCIHSKLPAVTAVKCHIHFTTIVIRSFKKIYKKPYAFYFPDKHGKKMKYMSKKQYRLALHRDDMFWTFFMLEFWMRSLKAAFSLSKQFEMKNIPNY